MWKVEQDVHDCVVHVVLMVEVVVIYCRCDYVVRGEIYGGLEDGGRMLGGCCREQDGDGVVVLTPWL